MHQLGPRRLGVAGSAGAVVSKKVQPEETCRPASVRLPLLRDLIEVLQIRDIRIVHTGGAEKRDIPRGMRVRGRDAPQECRLDGPWPNPGNGSQLFHGRDRIGIERCRIGSDANSVPTATSASARFVVTPDSRTNATLLEANCSGRGGGQNCRPSR